MKLPNRVFFGFPRLLTMIKNLNGQFIGTATERGSEDTISVTKQWKKIQKVIYNNLESLKKIKMTTLVDSKRFNKLK